MADKNVQMPDGTVVAFPDSMSDDAIAGILKTQHPSAGGTPQQGFFGSFADSSGLSGLAHAAAHPIDTIMGIPAAVKGAIGNTTENVKQGIADYKTSGLSETTRRDFGRAVPIVGPALATAQAQHDAGNNAGMAGTLAGTVTGLAAPAALKGLAPAAEILGDAAQDTGAGILNKTAGMLKSDFKRGANGGRAYLDSGKGPALSMQGLADKASDALEATGNKIQQVIKSSPSATTKIPANDVVQALSGPLKNIYDLETGPGGMGNTAPLATYAQGFKQTIADGIKNGGFTPEEVWNLKKSIAKNTSWTDPSQLNMKAVRQQQVGALGGLLTDKIPELDQLNQNYQGLLKFADRTQSRADTHSMPLTSLAGKVIMGGVGGAAGGLEGHLGSVAGTIGGLAADSIPVKSAAGYGAYQAGRGLSAIAPTLSKAATPATGLAAVGVAGNQLVNQNGTEPQATTNNQVTQATPPIADSNATTPKGQALWAQLGAAKLQDHIGREPNAEISAKDVAALSATPQGKSLLIKASDLSPGSAAMKNLTKEIQAVLGRTK